MPFPSPFPNLLRGLRPFTIQAGLTIPPGDRGIRHPGLYTSFTLSCRAIAACVLYLLFLGHSITAGIFFATRGVWESDLD